MSLDKSFFEKEVEKRYDELEDLSIKAKEVDEMANAIEKNKERVNVEIALINAYINILSQEGVAETAQNAE